jgi:hypothetical protein
MKKIAMVQPATDMRPMEKARKPSVSWRPMSGILEVQRRVKDEARVQHRRRKHQAEAVQAIR